MGSGTRDPMSAVLALGRDRKRAIAVGLLAALLVHGTAAARAAAIPLELMQWSQRIGRAVHERVVATYDIDLLKPVEPPPAPPPELPKDEPKEAPPPPAPSSAKTAPPDTPPPAAAAAQAGAVLTQQPDPNEPVDLTNSFVTGDADSYAGGTTQATGTSTSAVYARRVGPGTGTAQQGAGKGQGTAPVGQDRSRAASLAGSKEWKCDFPPEADVDQIDQAFVVVQVATRTDGSPDHVSILSDPGHGFGRAARVCAMKERYDPALDHDGNAIAGSTKSIRIRFER
jgi:protein TonB